jgi:antitoxin PrlF
MTEPKAFYRSRLRTKGQITVPAEIRDALGVNEGDDVLFFSDEQGRVMIARAQIIPPEQAWFWTKRWQELEREAQADIDAGRVSEFEKVEQALDFLDQAARPDAEN